MAVKSADVLKVCRTAVSQDRGRWTNTFLLTPLATGQGNAIGQYTSRNCGVSCEITITFGNPRSADVAYCFAYQDRAGRCLNDRSPPIFKRRNGVLGPDLDWANSATKRDVEPEEDFGLFMLAGGMEVVMRE